MGTITLTVEGTTVGTVAAGKGITVKYEVSEQDSARLIKTYGEMQAQRTFGIDPALLREPTIEDIIQGWFTGVINESIQRVTQHEVDKKARAAQATVTPIAVTIKE